MKKITISDFSGGIQESDVPNDFSQRQWSKLRGIIPKNDRVFESQWNTECLGSILAPRVSELPEHAYVSVDAGNDDPNNWSPIYKINLFQQHPGLKDGSVDFIFTKPDDLTYNDARLWERDGDGWSWDQVAEFDDNLAVLPDPGFDTIALNAPNAQYLYIEDMKPWKYDGSQETPSAIPGILLRNFDDFGGVAGNETNGLSFTLDDGNSAGFVSVHPLASSSAATPYLVGIKSNGTIWWANRENTLTYSQPRNVVWTQIEESSNPDEAGDPIEILSNADYKFICDIPLQTYKYVVDPDNGDEDNPSKDIPLADSLEVSSGVLINSTTIGGDPDQSPQQVLVAYVDNEASDVKVIVFPNLRRVPLHDKDAGDFIKAYVGNDTYVSMPSWLTDDEPYRAMHPYTYLDINATLLPGRGIIPRANVGVVKNNLLLLGDIEWRSDLSQETPTKQDQYLYSTSGSDEFDTREFEVVWPAAPFPQDARVIFNEGPGILFLKDDDGVVADIIDYTFNDDDTVTLTTQLEHGFSAGETIEISNMNDLLNGTYELVSASTTTFVIAKEYNGRNVIERASSGIIRTITTASNHRIISGQYIAVTDVAAFYNGNGEVTSTTDTTISYKFGTAVASRASSGTTKTIVTAAPHNLSNGDTVEITGVGGTGYDIASPGVTITVTNSTTFTYTGTASSSESTTACSGTVFKSFTESETEVDPAGLVDVPPTPIESIYGTGEYLTVTTKYVHGFLPDRFVNLNGVTGTDSIDGAPSRVNGIYPIVEVPSSKSFNVKSPYKTSVRITNRDYDEPNSTATLDTAVAHNFIDNEDVVVSGLGSSEFNGTFEITGRPTSTEFTYEFESAKTYGSKAVTRINAVANSKRTVTGGTASSPVGRVVSYDYRIDPGSYQAIPNAWTSIYATSSTIGTKIKAVKNLNTAYHLLNDTNTGPHRGAMYFATGGDIDTFDPRAVLQIGKSDVTIAGMHVLNDNVIVVTTAGGPNDGVHRITGFLSRLIQYGAQSDPNAVRIQLLRGGLGAPARNATVQHRYSTTWSEAGIVVFIDRLGGIWYTNGSAVDRLDRVGPKQPSTATENDHVCALGKHLFVWRDGRLLCLTMMESVSGGSGSACWTEVSLPVTNISNMVSAGSYLYFISAGRVFAMSPQLGSDGYWDQDRGDWLTNEPGRYMVPITVTTAPVGDASSHRRVNWHRFGVSVASTFPTIASGNIRLESISFLSSNGAYYSVELDEPMNFQEDSPNASNATGDYREYVFATGLGPQPAAKGTVVFRGSGRLISASFWVTGDYPRDGDPA